MSLFKKTIALAVCAFVMAGCSPVRYFYYPNNHLYVDPKDLGHAYEMKWFSSLKGEKLFALYFKTTQESKGVVVHFHGNYGNVSNHFPMSFYLTDYGYDVLIFDYQGYGASEGHPSIKSTINDGIAALRYATELAQKSTGRVFVLGHSLGGAIALGSLAQEPLAKAAVIQASFTGYRVMGWHVLKKSVIGWLLMPVVPFFIGTAYDPIKVVKKIHGIPLFFIHGALDEVVPVSMTKRLVENANSPKQLWIVPSAGHNNLRPVGGKDYEKRVADFFDQWDTYK